MSKTTNQEIKSKEEEKIVYDQEEFNKIQDELVEKTKGKFFKAQKPNGVKFTRKTLTKNLVSCLIFTYKHFKYSDGLITDYYQKKDLLHYLNEFPHLIRNFHHLKYWDCIQQMPTSPTEIIYKKGWYGITENGIAFVQKEIGLPKYALVHNDFAYEHTTNPYVMITDFFTDEELNDLLKL
tara:strand:+ start:114 stop:653 length:540 start_codon:yes stop_codon:yes gene_type:complete